MNEINRAVQILRSGALVAFPTETVYGLGADARSAAAVRRIFAVKGRPAANPLICHVADVVVARRYVTAWPGAAEALARAFWPGPLTLVLPKSGEIVDEATAGLRSVGLRAPNHPLALELLRAFGGPLAGPSANKSNHISPTTAEHVRAELGAEVDLVLDGGPCDVGIESTVLDLVHSEPRILRPGGVSREQIEAIVGPVQLVQSVIEANTPAASPGLHAKHYAPRTAAYRFEAAQRSRVPVDGVLTVGSDPVEYARRFYETLRRLDARNLPAIYIEMPPDTPAWTAVRDRIRRATEPLAD